MSQPFDLTDALKHARELPALAKPRSGASSSAPPTAPSNPTTPAPASLPPHSSSVPQAASATSPPPEQAISTELLVAILESNLSQQKQLLQAFFASLKTGQELESPPTAESRAIDRLQAGVKETTDVILGMRGEVQSLGQLLLQQTRMVRRRSVLPMVATGAVLILLQAVTAALSSAVAIAALTDRTLWEVLRAVLLS